MCPVVHNKELRGSISKSTNKVDSALIASLGEFKDCDLLLGIHSAHIRQSLVVHPFFLIIAPKKSSPSAPFMQPNVADSRKVKVELGAFFNEIKGFQQAILY